MFRRTQRAAFTSMSWDPIGKVHPDVTNMWGRSCDFNFRGRGWTHMYRMYNVERIVGNGSTGNGGGNACRDVNARVFDPEDARHPLIRCCHGPMTSGVDGAVHDLMYGNFGPIPEKARLLQVLYDNYLEPFNMHRVDPIMAHYGKNNPANLAAVEYVCPTCSIIGAVKLGGDTTMMHNVVVKGDTGQFWSGMHCQFMENCCFICDAPSTLHHYMREEKFNPYQTWEHTDGSIMIHGFCMIEPGCTIEACHMAMCVIVGHSTKIHKDVKIGQLARILPGSVVVSGTNIGEGELWGGAPARKLGKISKFDYKLPYDAAWHHSYAVYEGKNDGTQWGDQYVYGVQADDQLSHLAIQYEQNLSPSTKGQVREMYEGGEPFTHTVARVTQFWQPLDKQEQLAPEGNHPWTYTVEKGPYSDTHGLAANAKTGTIFNWQGFATENRW